MKTFLLFIALCTLYAACEKKKAEAAPMSITISAIGDITDQHMLLPQVNPLLQLYHCSRNPDAAFLFRLRTISDKKLTPVLSCRLVSAKEAEAQNKDGDPQFRNKCIISFYNRVRHVIGELYRQADSTHSLLYSECIRTLFSELQFLASDTSEKKYLMVFSDLMEKSDLLNTYDSEAIDAEAITRRIDKIDALPQRLNGITVVFVFSPKDRHQDQQFSRMSTAFTQLLENRGAKVLVQASNISYEL